MGTLLFYLLASIFVFAADLFSEVNTNSKEFENLYYRIVVNTTWFPVGQGVSYMALSVLGWAFINLVNMQKSDPFTSGNNDHKSFHKFLIVLPIIFMSSMIIVFK